MLIGGTFVPIYGNSLIDQISKQILFLAQRLHDQLLQVFGKQFKAVFVRKDNHIFLSLAIGQIKPA